MHLGFSFRFIFLSGFFRKSLLATESAGVNNQECSCAVDWQDAERFITAKDSKFGPGIEGASVNRKGEIFATDFGTISDNKIGRITPTSEEFYSDPIVSSEVHGVRFFNSTTAYVADMTNHRIIKLNLGADGSVVSSSTVCHNDEIYQPNDLTITKEGIIYMSGFRFNGTSDDKSGDVWWCDPNTQTTKRVELMGITNGIEVSNDNRHLLVSETYVTDGVCTSQKVFRYDINEDGTLSNKELFANFEKIDQTQAFWIDGMRLDTAGNLYIARYGGSRVTVLNPNGQLIKNIRVNFTNPTNIEFGGENGNVLYIVGKCDQLGPDGQEVGCVDFIKTDSVGKAITNLRMSN